MEVGTNNSEDEISELIPSSSFNNNTSSSAITTESFAKTKLRKFSTSLKNAKDKFHSTDSGLDVSILAQLIFGRLGCHERIQYVQQMLMTFRKL